jgi:hypothetical protein
MMPGHGQYLTILGLGVSLVHQSIGLFLDFVDSDSK